MLSEKNKRTLYNQVIGIYRKSNPEVTEEQIMERIDLFDIVLNLATESSNTEIQKLPHEMEVIFDDIDKARLVSVENIRLIEPYLRLMCYLADLENYMQDEYDKKTLGSLYKALDVLQIGQNREKMGQYLDGLAESDKKIREYFDKIQEAKNNKVNPSRIDFWDILIQRNENNKPFDVDDFRYPEKILNGYAPTEPCIKAYCGRNAIVHSQNDISEEVKWDYFVNFFYTMIEVAYQYRKNIVLKYTESNKIIKQYVNKIIKNYEEKLNGNFKYIPVSLEIFELNDIAIDVSRHYGDRVQVKFEEINQDVNGQKAIGKTIFNKIKIIGYAGAGKTTLLENLQYQEALELKKKGYKGKIPVIIELIGVTSNQGKSIKQMIAQKLEANDLALVSMLLERNMLNIYIDAINEINIADINEREKFLQKIQEFVHEQKYAKMIIMDRDSNENSILNELPTFLLNGMTDENIEEFILGNSASGEFVNQKIQEALETRQSLREIIRNPFMLKSLITIVEYRKEVPKRDDDLAGACLEAIVERERIIKRERKAKHIIRLLTYIVGKYVVEEQEKNNNIPTENMVIGYYKLIEICDEFCKKYAGNEIIDNNEMLDLLIKLGILKRVEVEKYTFVDYRYYNYFFFLANSLEMF